MGPLIVLHSYHHNNTRKIAEAISNVIGAIIKSPFEIEVNELQKYDLIGFGSGIDSGMHYKELIDFAEELAFVNKKNCFIFSTSAMQGKDKVNRDHSNIRKILDSKGYNVIGEFSCKGFNTNSFLKYIGGMNKKRPNDKDILNAKNFALKLK